MTKEERIKKRDADIDAIIDRFDMTTKCSLTRESIHERVIKAMVSMNWLTCWLTCVTRSCSTPRTS